MVGLNTEDFDISLYQVWHFSLQNWPIVDFSQLSWRTCSNENFDSAVNTKTSSLVYNDLLFGSWGFRTHFGPLSVFLVKYGVGKWDPHLVITTSYGNFDCAIGFKILNLVRLHSSFACTRFQTKSGHPVETFNLVEIWCSHKDIPQPWGLGRVRGGQPQSSPRSRANRPCSRRLGSQSSTFAEVNPSVLCDHMVLFTAIIESKLRRYITG